MNITTLEQLKRLFIKYKHFTLYGIIGVFCVLLDYSIFHILTNALGIVYLVSNVVSVSSGLTVSFILNRKFNFKVKDRVMKRFIYFYLTGMIGLIISTGMLILLVEHFFLETNIAKIISILTVVLLQFSFNKRVTFRI